MAVQGDKMCNTHHSLLKSNGKRRSKIYLIHSYVALKPKEKC